MVIRASRSASAKGVAPGKTPRDPERDVTIQLSGEALFAHQTLRERADHPNVVSVADFVHEATRSAAGATTPRTADPYSLDDARQSPWTSTTTCGRERRGSRRVNAVTPAPSNGLWQTIPEAPRAVIALITPTKGAAA